MPGLGAEGLAAASGYGFDMATTAKLVTDLSVTLRGIRSHEGVIGARRGQAASNDVAKALRETEARETVVADRVARVLRGLGAPAPRALPAWFPTPVSLAAAAASSTQPLGEALVLEAATVRMLADRARVVHDLAVATGQRDAADVATQVSDLYDEYAGWLVKTAGALVVDEDHADLTPSATQRLAGRVKDVVGAPARLYGQAADRAAAGLGDATDRVRDLVGLGAEKVDDAVDSAVDTAVDTVTDAADAAKDAVTPVQASDLPVTRYDARSAADAAKAVRGLKDADDVSTVLEYESRHKDRKTVIEAGERRVEQLTDARS